MSTFNITAAIPEHTQEIVQLLKNSLGEQGTPKSIAYWQWKHEQNVFGSSYTFVAIQNNRIVGVRALMQWQWTNGQQYIQTVRAVDTATHPEYQGKGIFKALTLHAIQYCASQNVQLVFNTPNKKSMPGYLKMGWQKANNLPIIVKWPFSKLTRYEPQRVHDILKAYTFDPFLKSPTIFQYPAPTHEGWHTVLNIPYLQWRYASCPVVRYGILTQNGLFGFIFTIKKQHLWQELRICNAWCLTGAEHLAQQALRKLCSQVKPAFVSFTQSAYTNQTNKMLPGICLPFVKGPNVTLKPLSTNLPDGWNNYKYWQPSLGDMELF